MGLLSRLVSPFVRKHTEGEYREGPYMLPLSGGWLPAGSAWNFWQLGQDVRPYGAQSAMVEACISAYAQTAAMCPGDHWRSTGNGGRERVTTSALSRLIKKPNDYQSGSDLLLNLVWQLYQDGEAFALALRNNRLEISELHLMRTRDCRALVAEDGSIFYELAGNEVIARRMAVLGIHNLVVPARDVLHVRLKTPRHPLKGESPIMAAALDVAAQNVMLQQQIAFFTNRSRPSFVLTTEEKLTPDQARDLRTRWEEQSQGLNEGKTPVLSWGIKPMEIGNTAADAQLAETMKMSEQHIALAFRMPLQVLGLGSVPQASTEALMQQWLASGLGFCLNHVETAFDGLFGLRGWPDEYLELDTRALLRSAFKDRMEGLARGVLAGILAPDEARAGEEYAAVPGGFGAMPRVQQQVVPLDWHDKQPAPSPQLPAPAAEPVEEPDEDAERNSPDAIFRRLDDLVRVH